MWWGGKWKVVTWWAIFKQIYPPRHRWTRPVFGTSFTEPIIVKKSAHQNTPLGKSHRCLIHTTCRRNIDLQSKMSITRERGFNRCFSFYRSRPRSIEYWTASGRKGWGKLAMRMGWEYWEYRGQQQQRAKRFLFFLLRLLRVWRKSFLFTLAVKSQEIRESPAKLDHVWIETRTMRKRRRILGHMTSVE